MPGMRLAELHPATVHYPLALLPLSIGADAVSYATRSKSLATIGKWGVVGAALTAGVAGALGLVAQEEVDLDAAGERVLRTHRTLNLGLLGALTAMAAMRVGQRRPSLGYLALGLGAFAIAGVSAYLGGKLTYEHGAGVERPRQTARDLFVPARRRVAEPAGFVAKVERAVRDVGRGVKHTVQDAKRLDRFPTMTPPPKPGASRPS